MLALLAPLALLWFCLGAVIGLIANVANLRPASWRIFGWVRMVAVGALTAFCGGWLGILLLGRSFATVGALWVAVVGVVCIPWLLSRIETGSMRHPLHILAPSALGSSNGSSQTFEK